MPAIQVRDLPQELYDQLVEAARRDRRSIAQETTFIIEEYCSAAYTVGIGRNHPSPPLLYPDTSEHRGLRHELVRTRIMDLPTFEVPPDFPRVTDLLTEEREHR